MGRAGRAGGRGVAQPCCSGSGCGSASAAARPAVSEGGRDGGRDGVGTGPGLRRTDPDPAPGPRTHPQHPGPAASPLGAPRSRGIFPPGTPAPLRFPSCVSISVNFPSRHPVPVAIHLLYPYRSTGAFPLGAPPPNCVSPPTSRSGCLSPPAPQSGCISFPASQRGCISRPASQSWCNSLGAPRPSCISPSSTSIQQHFHLLHSDRLVFPFWAL